MNNDKVGFRRSDLRFLLHFFFFFLHRSCLCGSSGSMSAGTTVILTLAQNITTMSLLSRIVYSEFGEITVPEEYSL